MLADSMSLNNLATSFILPCINQLNAYAKGTFPFWQGRLQKGYNPSMERVFRKFSSFKESEKQDIEYYVNLSVDERQAIARELKKRAFGDHTPDIRQYHTRK